jgi:hypothetical protein
MSPPIAFSSACATRAPTRQPAISAPASSGRNQASRGSERGQPFNPQSVRAMIEGPQPRQRRAERHRLINLEQD